jgi:hypothetical protein
MFIEPPSSMSLFRSVRSERLIGGYSTLRSYGAAVFSGHLNYKHCAALRLSLAEKLLSLGKERRNDPRNHTKWSELNFCFVLISGGFVDRFSLSCGDPFEESRVGCACPQHGDWL